MLSIAIFVLCLFVFVLGMIGLNRYADSKVKSKVSRLVFSSIVGFALGLAPIMFFIGTTVGPLNDPVSTRIMLGLMSIISLLAWILCAVLLSDAADIDLDSKTKAFIGTMLAMFLIMWIVFSGLAYTGFGTFGGFGNAGTRFATMSPQAQQMAQMFRA
jgi:hypothetical protein